LGSFKIAEEIEVVYENDKELEISIDKIIIIYKSKNDLKLIFLDCKSKPEESDVSNDL